MKKLIAKIVSLALCLTMLPGINAHAGVSGQYTNPLMNGADPTIVRGEDGYFYSGFGTDNDIYIKRSESLLGLSTAESHLVWDNPNSGNPDNNKNFYIWGPYIYRLDGAWYIYYSSSTENDFGYGHPSCYVLENTSEDPFTGEWHLKGSSTNVDDFEGNATEKAGLMNTESYGLACGVITIGGEQYFTYTKYDYYANEPGHTKFNECPTIVKMANPWTLTGPECTVARPTYAWEKHGDNIDEGCAVVEHGGKVYFAYSVSSFTNDNYGVGLSVCDLSTDVMDENNWKKSTTPIVSRSDENSSFGPGSPLFVKSPDGTEDWLIYHGGPIGGQTSTDRRVRAQIINWTDDGEISLGIPSNPDTVLDFPSGEVKSDVYEAEDANYGNVTKRLFNNTAKASGSGYMQFDKAGTGYVEFNVNMTEAGTYALGFRYNNTGNTVNADLSVNGAGAGSVSFIKNATYAVDLDIKKAYNIHLNEGMNTIRVSVNGASDLALDTLIVTKAVKYDAVNAEKLNGAFIEGSDHVGGMYNDNATVRFTVDVPSTGYYAVNLTYTDGHRNEDGKKYATVYVNGAEVKRADFFPTGGWGVFGSRIDNLYLKKGVNTISYVNVKDNGANTGDVNYYYITVTEAVTHTYKAESVSSLPEAAVSEEAVVEDLTIEAEETAVDEAEAEETVETAETQDATVPESHTVYVGTEAEFINGAGVEGDHVGYMYNGRAAVKFHVSTLEAGLYTVNLEYANGHESDAKKTAVYVNGEKCTEFDIPYTGPWNTWNTADFSLNLAEGENIIALVNDADDLGVAGDVNYKSLTLNAPKTADFTDKTGTVRLEAELAGLSNGATVETNNLGFSKLGFAGGMYNDGACVTYTFNAPYAGEYTVNAGYANGHDVKKARISVNGSFIKELDLPNTGGWTSYGTVTTTLNLQAGRNTISFANINNENGPTGDVNYDYVDITVPEINLDPDPEEPQEPEEPDTPEIPDTPVAGALEGVAEFDVSVESEALYDIAICYSHNADVTGTYGIYVGDERKATASFAAGKNEEVVTVKLNAGNNEIKVVYEKNDDSTKGVTVTKAHLQRRIPWYYQAENGNLTGVSVQNDHLFYEGTGFVGGFEQEGNAVEFTTKVAHTGVHTIAICYSGAWDHDITVSLYVNGKKYKQLSLAPTGSWDEWAEASEEVYLRSGKNSIEIRRDADDSGSFNVDQIVIDKYSTGAVTAEVGKLISGEVYVIKDKHSGMAADIDGYSPDAGRDIHLWHYLGNNNQKWKLVDLGNGYWAFKGTYGSKRISIRDNLNLVTADENLNDLGQQWTLEPVGIYYKLRNRKNGLVLSVAGDSMSAGAMLIVSQNENKDSQLFLVDGGLRHNSTEVRELENTIDISSFDPYGHQYTLVDPVIPEGFDPSTTVNDGTALRYEAAKATLSDGARVETEHTGYLAKEGYVGGMYAGNAAITFRVNIEKSGNYDLNLGYCNGFNENKMAALTVNGVQVTAPTLTPTSSWDTWGSVQFNLDLKSGVNTIQFMNRSELTNGLRGDVNYDYLDIAKYPNTITGEESPSTAVNGNRHFEAEDAALASGAKVETDHNGFSGDGFVGGMYNGGAKICFNINVAEAGTYSFDLRYCNGHGADVEEKVPAVTVNGKFITGVSLPKTGSWDSWGTVRFELPLNAGLSEVGFVNTSSLTGHAGDVNYDYIELVTAAPEDNKSGDAETTVPGNNGNGKGNGHNNGKGTNNGNHFGWSNSGNGTSAEENAGAGRGNAGRALGLNKAPVIERVEASLVNNAADDEALTQEEAIETAEASEEKAPETTIVGIGDEETALSAPKSEEKSNSFVLFAVLGTLAVAILGALGYYLKGKKLK
jgi:GH43 family beta-xylosidase/uncharacterized protein YegP (UPF0339 family)